MTFSPDGKYMVTGSGKTVRLWGSSAQRVLPRDTPANLSPWLFPPDGKQCSPEAGTTQHGCGMRPAARKSASSVTRPGTRRGLFPGRHAGAHGHWGPWLWPERQRPADVQVPRFVLQGTVVGCGQRSGNSAFPHARPVFQVAFSPDGKQVITRDGPDHGSLQPADVVHFWDWATGVEIHPVNAPDGKQRLAGANVWDVPSGKAISGQGIPGFTQRLKAVSADGKLAVLEGTDPGRRSGGPTAQPRTDHAKDAEREKMLALVEMGRFTEVWDLSGAKLLFTISHKGERVGVRAFSPDGRYIFTGGEKRASLWDAASGKEIQTIEGSALIWSVAFSPDGKRVLTGCDDGKVGLWDPAANDKELASFQGLAGPLSPWPFPRTASNSWRGVMTKARTPRAAQPAGKAAETGDNTARLWDLAGGKLSRTFHHAGLLSGMAFSADGKQILTGSWGRAASPNGKLSGHNMAQLWDAASGDEMRLPTPRMGSSRGHFPRRQAGAHRSTGRGAVVGCGERQGDSHVPVFGSRYSGDTGGGRRIVCGLFSGRQAGAHTG